MASTEAVAALPLPDQFPVLAWGAATGVADQSESQERSYQQGLLSAGGRHTCAVLTNRTVRCWGLNDYGQLGDGSLTNHSSPVNVVGISTAVEVEAGYSHSCARLADGTIVTDNLAWEL